MQNLHTEINFLHPSLGDLERVYEFGNACDIADYGEPDTDLGDLQDLWSEADLEKDAWLALSAGDKMIGYALISGSGERFFLDLYSHRTLTPPAVAERLLANCEQRASDRVSDNASAESPNAVGFGASPTTKDSAFTSSNDAVSASSNDASSTSSNDAVSASSNDAFFASSNDASSASSNDVFFASSNEAFFASSITGFATEVNSSLRSAFEARGFKVYTYHFRMQMDYDLPVPPPNWPAGFQLSPFQPSDEQELYQLIESTFDWPGRTPTSIERWRELVFRSGRFEPELFLMLRRAGRLIGASLSYDERPRGWIKQLSVAKDLQGQGIGSLLLRHTLSVFNQKGMDYAALGVSAANQKAVEFYKRCGMRQSRLFLEYRKDIVF